MQPSGWNDLQESAISQVEQEYMRYNQQFKDHASNYK
jgi:hypothetical protein